MLLKSGVQITLLYIKGHKDNAENFQNLTRWAQLNIIADHMAKHILIEFLVQGNEVRSSSFHSEGWP